MAEVPEHLLQRARARRAALSGGDAPAAPEAAAAEPTSSSAVEKAASPAAPAPGGGTAAAVAETAAAPLPEATPAAPVRRSRVPAFVMPVLVMLPLWAILYAGAFGERGHQEVTPIQLGQQLYAAQGCSGCHGGDGGGGVGPALAGGEVELTFPDPADHIAWIKGGSASVGVGNPYGDPARGRIARGGMPAYPNLSQAQLEAIVLYEREGLR